MLKILECIESKMALQALVALFVGIVLYCFPTVLEISTRIAKQSGDPALGYIALAGILVVLVAVAAAVIRCLYPKVQPKAELRLREIVSLLIDLAIQFMMAEMIARTAVAIK